MAHHYTSSIHELLSDAPPPYELATPRELIDDSANVQDDGRVDVDVDSRLYRALSRFIPSVPDDATPTPLPRHYKFKKWTVRLNIVIQVVGSRGDVQPFIALGNELRKYGHRVRLATHNIFEDFVRKSGLEFYPIGGDPAQLMAYMVKNPGLIPGMKSLRAGDIQQKRSMVEEMLEGCWKSCIEADKVTGIPFVAEAIIANPPSFAHIHCAQALGVPLHLMFTMPWSSTRVFPHPLANLKGSNTDPRVANYASYWVVEWLAWQGLGDVINKWRKIHDLEPVPATEGPNLAETLKVPFTYCWSPALVPKPADWPSYIDVCGFFFRDPPGYIPPPDLDQFLRAGPPPVYIGFGSIVVDDPDRLSTTILETVKMLRIRAIISRGWSKLAGDQSDDVYYIGDCPHEWLFQHVAAVVHHGGAGTTACGLRYGRPTMVVPFFGDQPFWGNMIHAAGAGPKPIPFKFLSSQNLAEAISYCLTPEAQISAQDIASKMKTESGVEAAAQSFHANLPLELLQCDILPDRPAVWAYKKGNRPVKLSKLAAEILIEYMEVNEKSLKLYESNPILVENHRWDPVTGTLSAALGTGKDILKAATDIVVKPYEAYRDIRLQNARPGSSHSEPRAITSVSPVSDRLSNTDSIDSNALSAKSSDSKNGIHTARVMAAASAKGVGRFFVQYTKGTLVDIPLACTEGLRAVPKLYGEEVKDYGNVKDWKTGMTIAGKMFVHGTVEGVADIFVQPYKGGKEEGAWGVAKGIGKGSIGGAAKISSAAMGLVAYPGKGISRSIHAAINAKTRSNIMKAMHEEGQTLFRNTEGLDHAAVIKAFDKLRKGIDQH
ncbi:glycosyltransferase family 1 protein [Glonium stellatum]|uniref:Glycosyltransferase family 1 protein n=1 Tax=Glonium stellatum TaxID=574774 RepID=A0A8E2JUQ0_9PEZI|nr:glycosyltransferase family 1 protein [Glonium stellatum]